MRGSFCAVCKQMRVSAETSCARIHKRFRGSVTDVAAKSMTIKASSLSAEADILRERNHE